MKVIFNESYSSRDYWLSQLQNKSRKTRKIQKEAAEDGL